MINLDPKILVKVSKDYCTNMAAILIDKYNNINNIKPIEGNPFTNRSYIELFENGYGLDKDLVEDLLCKPFEEICGKYPEINNYITTCKLVYFSSFQVDKELERRGEYINQSNRERFRIEYVAQFYNPWLRDILTNHTYYYQNTINFKAFVNDVEGKLTDLNYKLAKIVDYDLMESEYRHRLLSEMGIEVCPYCNRQYITKYTKDGKLKTTADLDHFFPKLFFQLLTLSLFNFVPSCQICNSRFKLAKSAEILYPYYKGFDENTYFKVQLTSESTIDSIIGNNITFDLDLIVNPIDTHKKEIENSIKLFHLKEVYQSHKDYVRELLYKKNAHSKTYKNQLNELFIEMKLEPMEINLFLYGNSLHPPDFGKRPLSKLAFDIIHNN